METLDAVLAHYGVKGMKWGVKKEHVDAASRVGGLASTVAKARSSETKKSFNAKVGAAGGLHKVSDKDLKAMLNRLDMEKRYSKMQSEDADRRKEGVKAAGKILLEVGKIALPIALGVAASRAASGNGVFRTKAYTTKKALGR